MPKLSHVNLRTQLPEGCALRTWVFNDWWWLVFSFVLLRLSRSIHNEANDSIRVRRRPRREEQQGIQSPWHNKRSDPLTSATLRREGTGQVQPMLRGWELSQGMSTWVGFLEAISEAATQWLCPWEEWVEASSRNLAICIGSSRDTLGWRYRFGA